MIQMIYNDTSDRSGCQRKRAASEILMMTSSVMPWRKLIKDKRGSDFFEIKFRKLYSRARDAKSIILKKTY